MHIFDIEPKPRSFLWENIPKINCFGVFICIVKIYIKSVISMHCIVVYKNEKCINVFDPHYPDACSPSVIRFEKSSCLCIEKLISIYQCFLKD